MARPDKVTRTFKTAKVTFLIVDTKSGATDEYVATFPKPFKTDEKAIKAVNSFLADGIKAVAVRKTEVLETLYEMSAEKFLLNATPVEKR